MVLGNKKINWRESWLLAVVCLFVLLAEQAAAAKGKVHFEGNHSISSRIIQRWLAEIDGCPANELAQRLRDKYRRNGYYDALVTVLPGRQGPHDTTLRITEGPAVRLGVISVVLPDDFGDPFDRSLVSANLSGIASAENIDRSLTRLVQAMVDAGYPLARISPTDFKREGNKLHFTVQVNPGPQVRVGWWRISGLARTDTTRIRKTLALQTGVVWNDREKSRIRKRLQRLDYLRSAGDMCIVDGIEDTLVTVEIPLAERPALIADGGLGIAGGEAAGGLRGRLQLAVENPFGGGRRARLLISRPGGRVSQSRLRFADPHIAGSRVGVSLELEQQRQAAAYDRFSGAAGTSVLWGCGVQAEFEVRWTKITPLKGLDNVLPGRRYDFSLAAGNRFPYGPHLSTGWRVSLTASVRRDFGPEVGVKSQSNTSRIRFSAGLGQYWKPAGSFALHLAGSVESWLGPDEYITWGDELYLGGPETVRGFAERSFMARGYALFSTEAGYYPTSPIGMFIFADLAFLRPFALSDPDRFEHLVAGYGLGLETTNYLGRTRLEVGWPEGGATRDGVIYLRWLRGW